MLKRAQVIAVRNNNLENLLEILAPILQVLKGNFLGCASNDLSDRINSKND